MFINHINDIANNQYILTSDRKNVVTCINDQYKVVSNVCPHQKSLISTSSGNGGRVCPYHGWSFNLDGQPLGSGTSSCKNDKPLKSVDLHQWNSLLLTKKIDCPSYADFSKLELAEHRVDIVNSNAVNIMDVFLDVDHIPIVHKGVYDQIGLKNAAGVQWKYYNWGSLQLVPREAGYGDEFKSTLLDEDKLLDYSAFWLAVYPGTMIEWQPGAVFITVCKSLSEDKTAVDVYKYRDTRYNNLNWTLNENIWELAWAQDKQQVELITEINQENLEDAKLHFRQFIKAN